MSQPWAGQGWGGDLHRRASARRSIVDFLEGDPDRPIITGSVYNAEQHAALRAAGERHPDGHQDASSSKGGGGFNELRFEDKKGSEQVYSTPRRT